MKTKRTDLISRIAEALTGEALPRRQSTNVEVRGKSTGPITYAKDQSRLSASDVDEETSQMNYKNALWRLSSQHRRIWGKP
jgi:methionine synthase II (cobalamin-independent)